MAGEGVTFNFVGRVESLEKKEGSADLSEFIAKLGERREYVRATCNRQLLANPRECRLIRIYVNSKASAD